MSNWVEVLLLLCFFHYLADYPLQGDFLSKAKNHRNPIRGVPWDTALEAHAMIHAGFVFLVTGQLWAATAEVLAHALLDWLKCEGKIGFKLDQALHIWCKVVYVFICWWFSLSGGLGALYV